MSSRRSTTASSEQPLEPVWISVVPREKALLRARANWSAIRWRPVRPLYGVPFAIKDNIDLAGLPTTAACPAYAYAPARSATGGAGAGGRRRDSDRQDEHGSVRHRPGGHALAARRVFQRLRFALYFGRIQFRIGGGGGFGPGQLRARHRYRGVGPRARRVQRTGGAETHARRAQHAGRGSGLPDARLRLDLRRGPATTRTPCGTRRAGSTRTTVSRELPGAGDEAAPWLAGGFRFGVPPASQLEFFGDDAAAALYAAGGGAHGGAGRTQGRDRFLGFSARPRTCSTRGRGWPSATPRSAHFVEAHADEMNPVVRGIIEGARRYSAVDAFEAEYRLRDLRRAAEGAVGAHGRAAAADHAAPSTRTKRWPRLRCSSTPIWATTRISSTCWTWRRSPCRRVSGPTDSRSASR